MIHTKQTGTLIIVIFILNFEKTSKTVDLGAFRYFLGDSRLEVYVCKKEYRLYVSEYSIIS